MVTTLQEGYVQGELWQQVMNTNSGNFFLHRAIIMGPPPERLVSWNDIKRSPRLLVKEEPAYYGKDRTQPKYPVVPGQIPPFPFRSRCGFWVQPFFTNPVPGSRFDGLFQTYIDQSMMASGASGAGAKGGPGPQYGRTKNLIATLGDNEFRSWVDYYPEDHLYSVLYVRAWVMDHTPGNNRYIVPLPAMSRNY